MLPMMCAFLLGSFGPLLYRKVFDTEFIRLGGTAPFELRSFRTGCVLNLKRGSNSQLKSCGAHLYIYI